MSRCKACDAIMSSEDMIRKFPADSLGNKHYSDLCGHCHEESVQILYGNYKEPEEYNVTESLCQTHSLPQLQTEW